MTGSFSAPKPADDEVRSVIAAVQAQILQQINSKMSSAFEDIEVESYQRQTVAGVNYAVTIKCGGGAKTFVCKIFKSLGQQPTHELKSVEDAVRVTKKKESADEQRRRVTTASLRVHSVNLSHLLYIPPSIKSKFPGTMISTDDRDTQRRISKALRDWAEAVLNCQDVDDFGDDELASMRCAGVEEDPGLWEKKIQCDWWSVRAWNILGVTLSGPTQAAQIRGQPAHKRTCLIQAVACDPKYGPAWYNLAQQLNSPREGFEVNGNTYHKIEALVEAVTHDPENGDAWNTLCAQIPLPPPPPASSSPSSSSSAKPPAVRIAGRDVTKLDCYIKAVALSPKNSYAWNNLGNAVSQAHPYARSNSKLPEVTLLNGTTISNKDCYLRSLQLDPKFAISLYNLGALLRFGEKVDFAGRSWSKKQCLEEAFRYGADSLRKNGHVLTNVGHALTMQDTAVLGDYDAKEKRFYTKKDCYVAALELDSTLSEAWNGLGSVLPSPGSTVKIKLTTTETEEEFTRIDCYVQAIRHEPAKAATAWTNLGDSLLSKKSQQQQQQQQQKEEKDRDLLDDENRFSVDVFGDEGKRFTKRACYIEVLKLEPGNSDVWGKLGVVLSEEAEPSVRVGSRRFTTRDCFVEAVLHDASNANAWYNLGVNLGPVNKINITRTRVEDGEEEQQEEEISAQKCFVNVLSVLLNPEHQEEMRFQPEPERERESQLIAVAWNGLGNSIVHEHDLVSAIPGLPPLSRRDCYVRSVEQNPDLSTSWMNLGVSMGSELDKKTGKPPQIKVEVRPFGKLSQMDCFVQAVTRDDGNGDAWYNIILLMDGQKDVVTVRDRKMDKRAVMAKYDEVVAANPDASSFTRPMTPDL